ncbi:hypothetical protein BGZ73_003446 [Actinomortierella ambigua]|nr:hypothetical protein BGZ73_003446 [Actinomortierella ambigua]
MATTISKLEKAIYAVYPDKEDGEAVLAVIHPRGTSEGTEYPGRKTNIKTLTVALETPTKKYTDFTLKEVNSLIRAIPSDTFANEATCSAHVCSFLTQAVLIFNEVKHEDYRKGLAQNLVQLESSLTLRKRKRGSDDNGSEEREEDSSVPMRSYGIVTDASFWFFVECTIDPSQDCGDCPKFRISKLDDIVSYNKSTWREEAASVLGQIVWLMRKMHSEIPGRDLQLKKQKFTTNEQSLLPIGKMQRV